MYVCLHFFVYTSSNSQAHRKEKLVISRAEKKAIRVVKDTGQPELASPQTSASVNLAKPHLPSTQPPLYLTRCCLRWRRALGAETGMSNLPGWGRSFKIAISAPRLFAFLFTWETLPASPAPSFLL